MKNNDSEVKKISEETLDNDNINSSENNKTDSDVLIDRRTLVRQMTFAGLGLALPFLGVPLFAQKKPSKEASKELPKAPYIRFEKSTTGQGMIGPFGEVRIHKIGGEMLPIFISAFDGSAVMDFTVRTPFARIGAKNDSTAIMITPNGVKFGTDKEEKWSDGVARKLVKSLTSDRKKARGIMLLRAAFHTSFPVAIAQTKSTVSKRMMAPLAKQAAGYGSRAFNCVKDYVTKWQTRPIIETVEVIKTATQQYQECYDQQINISPCKDWGFGAGACAAAICAAQAFEDIVVGFIEVVVGYITEPVIVEVIKCAVPRPGEWTNPWITGDLFSRQQDPVPQPKQEFSQKDIDAALKLLTNIGGFLGDFGSCFLKGKWSLAQLNTPLDFEGTNVVIPYGVKVCISAECAKSLTDGKMFATALGAWGAALSALAALSPEFAATVLPLGITPAAAVVSGIASVPPIVVAAAAIILAFILLALLYGTAIAAQLLFHQNFTDNFNDDEVCIEHPTFAIALIAMATGGFIPAQLIPPIVTG